MSENEMLDRDRTQTILEAVKDRLTEVFDVHVIEDHNGAWGSMGATYVTLRFDHAEAPVEVRMLIQGVTDLAVEDRARSLRSGFHPENPSFGDPG